MQTLSRFQEWEKTYRQRERQIRRTRRRILRSVGCVLIGVVVTACLWPSLGWPSLLTGSCLSNCLLSLQN